MNYTYISISIFFIAFSLMWLFPAKWFNRSEVSDSELSFLGGICTGIAISCIILGLFIM